MAKKILYIEDDRALGDLIILKLTQAGYEAKHVISVEEAEKRGDFLAELLLVDQGLPGKQGIEAIPDLQKIFPQAKVVILSNFSDKDHLKRAQENGAADFWVKVGSLNNIVEQVNKILAS